jgi:hypothetical protein
MKLIFVLLLSCVTTTTTITPWGSIASNQAFTRNEIISSYNTYPFISLMISGNFGRTDQYIPKDSFLVKASANFNANYPAFSSKTSRQIIVKGDLTLLLDVSTLHGIVSCVPYTGSQILYCDQYCTRFYTNSSLTTPYVGGGDYYYVASIGMSVIISSTGYTSSITFC